ncbi:hypothetical protein EV278_107114 [Caulobacter sp. BK020]|nr:hypothetical protein EV278_107114 [Caulobacter sp. BK020]
MAGRLAAGDAVDDGRRRGRGQAACACPQSWSRLGRLTRKPAELMGRVRSARASPGVALMFYTVSTKFERFAWSRYPEAFGSRIFNPLRWRPPTGGELTTSPDRPGDFSPGLPRPPIPRRLGFVPTKENLPRTVAKGCHQRPPTNTSRSSTPEGRIGRRTCALPVPSGASIMGVVLSAPAMVTLIFLQGIEIVDLVFAMSGNPACSIPVEPAWELRRDLWRAPTAPGHLPLTLFLHGLYAKAP